MNRYPVIVLEGIDGVGKTTQTHMLLKYFVKLGFKPLLLREDPIKYVDIGKVGSRTTDSAFLLARMDLIENYAIPHCREVGPVIFDRHYLSTYVYAKTIRDDNDIAPIDDNWINFLLSANSLLNFWPDVHFVLDGEPHVSIDDSHDKITGVDFDEKSSEIRRKRYTNAAHYEIGRSPILFIQSHGTKEEVADRILGNMSYLELDTCEIKDRSVSRVLTLPSQRRVVLLESVIEFANETLNDDLSDEDKLKELKRLLDDNRYKRSKKLL